MYKEGETVKRLMMELLGNALTSAHEHVCADEGAGKDYKVMKRIQQLRRSVDTWARSTRSPKWSPRSSWKARSSFFCPWDQVAGKGSAPKLVR